MKQYKFRVWCKDSETMECFRPTGEFKINLNGDVLFADEIINSRVVVMMWAGLKDKNGVEIYESDIVKSLNHTFIVKWDNAGFQLFPAENNRRFWALTKSSAKSIEVIGNIWEEKK